MVQKRSSPHRFLSAAAATVIVIAGLRAAQTLIVPFVIALFVAILLVAPLHWLQRKRVPTLIGLLLIMAGVSLAAALVIGTVSQSVTDFTRRLPRYQRAVSERVQEVESWLRRTLAEWSSEAVQLGSDAANDPPEAAQTVPTSPAADRVPLRNPQLTIEAIRGFLGGVGVLLGNTAVILIAAIFMLVESSRLPDKIIVAWGESSAIHLKLREITDNVRRYIAIKTATSLLTGVFVSLLVAWLELDYPLLWGLLAFLFNFVPQIGSILAAIPAVVLALAEQGVATALVTAIGYLVINCVISYVIEPRVMGQGLGLSTAVVFLSLVFWGWVLGPGGMFLSAPLTMVLKIVLEDFDETRGLAILLGPRAPNMVQSRPDES